MTETTDEIGSVTWDKIHEVGSIHQWVMDELMRRDLIDEVTDTSELSDKERKRYKAQREEERRVRALLMKLAWKAYKEAHLVHVGFGVFHHDTADVDRFDIADPAARRKENQLPELKDVKALAKALGLAITRLRWLSFHREVDPVTHYHRWTVPKRSGGERLISAPKPELKKALRWIAQNITEHLPIHGAAHGFVPGRSTVSNAVVHAGATIIIKFDLKDFYPTVTMPRVKGLMRKAGYGEQVATILALLCTESPRDIVDIKGTPYHVATGPRSLPQGAPTSPSITNHICLKLDARLSAIASFLGLRYTRYADDLTFSFHEKGSAPIAKLMGSVHRVVQDEGFCVNQSKTRVMRNGRRQTVTGLAVNSPGESSPAPPARVPRTTVRRLRAAIKNRELGRDPGETSEGRGESLTQLQGMAAYVYMADPKKGGPLLERVSALIKSTKIEETDPTTSPENHQDA